MFLNNLPLSNLLIQLLNPRSQPRMIRAEATIEMFLAKDKVTKIAKK